MPRRKSLVFKSGQPAILSDRVLYFKDRTLRKRAAMGGVALPRQDIEDYYGYMAKQRGFAQAYGQETGDTSAVDFDFKAEVERTFTDIVMNQGEFAPDNIPSTLASMKAMLSEHDASAYRRKVQAELGSGSPGLAA